MSNSRIIMPLPSSVDSTIRFLFSWRMLLCLLGGVVTVVVMDHFLPDRAWVKAVSVLVVVVSLVLGWRWHRTGDFR